MRLAAHRVTVIRMVLGCIDFPLILREGDCAYRLSNESDGTRALFPGYAVPTLSQVIHDVNSAAGL